jgi:hypothetical protein
MLDGSHPQTSFAEARRRPSLKERIAQINQIAKAAATKTAGIENS